MVNNILLSVNLDKKQEGKSFFNEITKDQEYKILNNNLDLCFLPINHDEIFETHRLIIQFHGNLYNRDQFSKNKNLKIEEIISNLYEKFGITAIEQLDGIFGCIIVDKKDKKIFVCKDKIGVRPLYYLKENSHIIISSSLNNFSSLNNYKKELDHNSLAIYFQYGYVLQPNTIYKNIKKIRSGHYLEIDLKNNNVTSKKYWSLESLYENQKIELSESEVTSHAHKLLKQSIQKRVDSNLNHATFLSGGYDSSTVAALLQEATDGKLKTFTMGFSEDVFDEAPHAKKIAKYIGSEHYEHYFGIDDAKNILPKLCDVYEEPFADFGATPTILLSMMAKEHGIDVVLGGDGGDEVFATADAYKQYEKILAISPLIKTPITSLLDKFNPEKIPYLKDQYNFPTKYYKTLSFLKAKSINEMVNFKMLLFLDHELHEMLNIKDFSPFTTFNDIDFGSNAQSVDIVIGTYFKTFMTDGEIVKAQNALSYNNIDFRKPLLDIDLIKFMSSVPQDIKVKDNTKKYILKEIAHQLIPKELLDRPKSGFDIPFGRWMREDMKDFVLEIVNEETLKKDNILNPKLVLEIRDKFLNGNDAYKYKLWSILLFQLWYNKNFK
jgi:asparagine synthase (glutamine-hydrolysing)